MKAKQFRLVATTAEAFEIHLMECSECRQAVAIASRRLRRIPFTSSLLPAEIRMPLH